MKAAKCTSCGADINVDETKEAGICPYCKTAYSTEKVLKNENNTTNNAGVINNYYGTGPQANNIRVPKTPRPVLNVGLAILLCFFYIIPGIFYIGSVKKKQKEWDDKYTY